jgi:hypothetical protein
VNWFAGGGIMARAFGVLNAAEPPAPPGISTSSYSLDVGNDTLVAVLLKFATIETPEPYLIYTNDNVTLWPRSDWPAGGLQIRRPLVIVGWTDAPTALDLGNCAGCAALVGPWGNVTFDTMVLENLGYGDPSDVSAATYSVISASNLWFFNTSRRG